MKRITDFVVEKPGVAWSLAWGMVLAVALGGMGAVREVREREQLSALHTAAERGGLEIMAQTLDGGIMGALNLLGLVDSAVKADALGEGGANAGPVIQTLESLGRAVGAQGIFIVGKEGVVRSSWDNSGKPSTGLNVAFRPYYRTALRGQENVYAAVSLARGDRALYFSAPVHATNSKGGAVIGAAVARTDLAVVDALLRQRSATALLLSPQGVVFASNRPEWVGALAGEPSAERLRAIRDLKQFGNLFQDRAPERLPVAVSPGLHDEGGARHAVAAVAVPWKDPSGDWQLVLLEDLSQTVHWEALLPVGLGMGATVLLVLTLALKMLQGRYNQRQAADRLAAYTQAQAAGAEQKARLGAAGLKFQQTDSAEDLAATFFSEAHGLLGILQGVAYEMPEDGAELSCLASFACVVPPAPRLALGEGLLGQCAVERRLQVIPSPEGKIWEMHSGLGSTGPGSIVLAPVLLREQLLGVIELAFLGVPDTAAQACVAELVDLFALNLEILKRNQHTQAMLSNQTASGQAAADLAAFRQTLIDAIPYPVFFKGPDTRFLGFNRAYEHAFGVSREDLVGKRVLDLTYLPEADR